MTISNSGVEKCPLLVCDADAEDPDTSVWLHVLHSSGHKKLVLRSSGHKKLLYSPDTDVYHIGLTLIDPSVHDVYVQLSNISSPELRLLHLNKLLHSFRDDPDLSLVPLALRPLVLQTLFICSGSFSFFGPGKVTIMSQNAWFITGSKLILVMMS